MTTPTGEDRVERHRKYLASVQWKDAVYYSALEILDAYDTLLARVRELEGERARLEQRLIETAIRRAAAPAAEAADRMWENQSLVEDNARLTEELAQAEQRVQEVEEEFTDLQVAWQQQAERAIRAEQRVAGLETALKKIEALQSHCECWDISRTALTRPQPAPLSGAMPDQPPNTTS